MTANIEKQRFGEKVGQNRREKGFSRTIFAQAIEHADDGSQFINTVIQARFYWSGRITCYCCVWGPGFSGGGHIGGSGFHHESGALQRAFEDAGITFDRSFDGEGDDAMDRALKCVMSALDYPDDNIFLLHAHP